MANNLNFDCFVLFVETFDHVLPQKIPEVVVAVLKDHVGIDASSVGLDVEGGFEAKVDVDVVKTLCLLPWWYKGPSLLKELTHLTEHIVLVIIITIIAQDKMRVLLIRGGTEC